MSEEPTTKPTLDTLLDIMRGVRDEMRAGFAEVNERLDGLDVRLEKVEGQLDRATSVAHETRADLRELKKEMREHYPAVK